MSVYEELGIQPIVNASEPYTRIGGSVMGKEVVAAMMEAAESFVDMGELIRAVAEKAAKLTGNEGAFVTGGAGAGLVMAAAACLCKENGADEAFLNALPNTDGVKRKEILIFQGKYLDIIKYWRLIRISGAELIFVEPSEEAMMAAVNDRTAGVFLFPSPMYEEGIPTCETVIPLLKERGITVVVDAAAQLPPVSNLNYYTRILGADLAIFSGGKHIKGPQSTGLIIGKRELTEYCIKLACPNPRLGRPFKVGKEELVGFIKALELFVEEDPEEKYERQREMLLRVEGALKEIPGISMRICRRGRLDTEQPLLLIELPGDKSGEACNLFTRSWDSPVDVGFFKKENGMPNTIFINAYNLQPGEEVVVADAVKAYLEQ